MTWWQWSLEIVGAVGTGGVAVIVAGSLWVMFRDGLRWYAVFREEKEDGWEFQDGACPCPLCRPIPRREATSESILPPSPSILPPPLDHPADYWDYCGCANCQAALERRIAKYDARDRATGEEPR